MSILSELHQDHVNLSKLLEMLQMKVDKLKSGERPNFNLMADVVSYISFYADGYHHPREDQMYEYFSGRSKALDSELRFCSSEHAEMKSSSDQLSEAIDGVLHDTVMPMEQFATLLEAFVAGQVKHLDEEEGTLFPMIEEVAEDKDWQALSQQLPTPEDPLFGKKRAAEYVALYEELLDDLQTH